MKGVLKGISSAISYPRVLVYLRQIARELKRANDISEARLMSEYPSAYRAYDRKTITSRPKLVEISRPTTAELDQMWKKMNPGTEEDL